MKQALNISILALSLLACNNGTSDSSCEASTEYIEGMLLVHSGTATLGSNESKYNASERPAMKVHLDYDFFLSIHEMTCGEYRALAKKTVSPVWFDASGKAKTSAISAACKCRGPQKSNGYS